MSKRSRIFMFSCFAVIGAFFIRAIISGAKDGFRSPIWDYLGLSYITVWGAAALLAFFGLIGLLISNIIDKRRAKGKKVISKAYTISFWLSFAPIVLLLLYGLYCAEYGLNFMWSTTYGWQGFKDAIFLMGLIFSVIPVFPFCIFWQILYIVKYVRANKAAKAEPVLFVSERS